MAVVLDKGEGAIFFVINRLVGGYEIWFVSARRKSRAIMEWRSHFARFFQMTFEDKVRLFSD